MEKTNAIIEILVIGVVSCIGFTLLFLGLSDINLTDFSHKLLQFKDFSNLAIVLILAISYQLGWLINAISGNLIHKLLLKKVLNSLSIENINIKDYKKIRDAVYLKASNNSILKIKERLSAMRLLRAGILNMLLLCLGFLYHYWFISSIIFIFLILFTITSYNSYKDYILRVINTYNQLDT